VAIPPETTFDRVNPEAIPRVRTRLVQVLAGFGIARLVGAWSLLTFTTAAVPSETTTLVLFAAGVLFLLCLTLTLVAQLKLAVPLLLLTTTGVAVIVPDMLVLLALSVALLLYDWRLFAAGMILTYSVLLWRTVQVVTTDPTSIAPTLQINMLFVITVVSVGVRYYISSTRSTLSRAQRSAELLRTAAEVGQIAVGMVSLEDLLPRVVNFIRDRFGYYHVQIFLVDEAGEIAWLRASTGDVGKELVARGHHLNVGSSSVIGQVTQTGEIVIASDTDTDVIHYRNELLPDTRSELALPIRDGETVIGALDVQSQLPNAFPRHDLQALQIMTNLLAASIRNAKLFENQQRNMQENQRLYIEAEANLREIQRLNRQLTRESWASFVDDQPKSISVTLSGNELQRTARSSPLTVQATRSRQPVTHQQDGQFTLAVPIILRNEVIGTMEIAPDESLWEEDAVEIARAVSDRLAISLDNARLFEETQSVTQYEQRVNSIVSKYQSVSTVDELLQVTLAELGETLGAGRGSIRLSTKFATMDSDNDTHNAPNGA
jgi:GAF domain-containing protein